MNARMHLTLLALLAAPLLATAQQTPAASPPSPQAGAPPMDQARGVDAEIRVALFDLLENNTVPALRRLQALADAPIPMDSAHATALRGRPDLLFLLAEAQYRFGMDSAFRATAQRAMSGSVPPKYRSLLQAQMLLAAYRAGDFAGAVQLAAAMPQDETRGLALLVSGLSQYQLRNYAGARAAFANAERASAPYSSYARYMDVLARLRGDTSGVAAAVTDLRTLASSLNGEFANQVRLTAAQLAYQSHAYDNAASIAGEIAPASGLGAQALLTKAWAQYKAGHVAEAQQTFQAFASRYPQLPERDESRLMAAQAMLQQGNTDDAGRIFHAVADSANDEVHALQARSQSAVAEGARALVAARAAGLLFINDPSTGKTVQLEDAAGADPQVLAAAVSADSTSAVPAVAAAKLIGVADVTARVDSLGAPVKQAVPRRLFFTPASSAGAGTFASRSQALMAADVAVAMARYDLQESMRRQALQIAMLKQLQSLLASRHDSLAALAQGLDASQQKLAAVLAALDAASAKIKEMMSTQARLTGDAADVNLRVLDSLRTTLGQLADPDRATLDLETQAAQKYRNVAQLLATRMDYIIAHHPAFVMRDSVRARGDSLRAMMSGTQQALATAEQLVGGELARLESSGPADQARFNAAIASAESGRSAAEAQLVAAVEGELTGRANEMIAQLGRDVEAATFGTASTSFFHAIDQGQKGTTGTAGTGSASAGGRSGPPVATTGTPPVRQQ